MIHCRGRSTLNGTCLLLPVLAKENSEKTVNDHCTKLGDSSHLNLFEIPISFLYSNQRRPHWDVLWHVPKSQHLHHLH